MRILLLNPPFHRLMGVETGNFHLGLGYLATFLNSKGHECAVFDMELPLPDEFSIEYRTGENLLDRLATEHDRYVSAVADRSHPVWAEAKRAIIEYEPDQDAAPDA